MMLEIYDICQSFEDDHKYQSNILFFLSENDKIVNTETELIRNSGSYVTWFGVENNCVLLSGSEEINIEDFYYYEFEDSRKKNSIIRQTPPKFNESMKFINQLGIEFKSIIVQINLFKNNKEELYNDLEESDSEFEIYKSMSKDLSVRIKNYFDFFTLTEDGIDPRVFYLQSRLNFI